jgi:hypothetical protein
MTVFPHPGVAEVVHSVDRRHEADIDEVLPREPFSASTMRTFWLHVDIGKL